MSDKDFIAAIEQVTDPKEALQTLVKYQDFLGYDGYYSDLRKALLAMCERCSQ